MRPTCLIVDELHPSMLPLLAQGGIATTYAPNATPAEVLAQIDTYDGLIVRSKLYLDKAFFGQASRLKWVGRSGAGMDNIDVQAAAAAGVALFNAPEGNRDAVAEHTVGLMLALLNRIPQAHTHVLAGGWDRHLFRGTELGTKTVGIIGFGNTGRATAQRLRGFNCRILAYDKYLPPWAIAGALPATLNQIWAETDILSLHIPLTPETEGWVNTSFFSNFQKNIWLLNTARGKVLVQKDLLAAIHQGKVLGAALDVLENEVFNTLSATEKQLDLQLKNTQKVLFTPHVAGWTDESYARLNEVLAQKIIYHINNNTK